MKKYWKNNKEIISFLARVFVIWQTALLILSSVSTLALPVRDRFMYNDGDKPINPVFLWNRANFDGAYYLSIARRGYGTYQQVFFPSYPKIIKILTGLFFGRDLVAGVIISNISLLLFLYIFYQLILLDFDHKVARSAIIFLMLFPTSFFFGCVYTESLLLVLVLGSLYAARKQKWLIAGLLGALAANTRLTGIFLFPALLYEWWQQSNVKYQISNIKNLICILIVPLGLLSYMRFLKINFNDPLLFVHSQPFFGAERSGDKIILFYQVLWRYLKMILTTKFDYLYFAVWLEFLTAVGFIYLLIQSYFKKIRLSYLVFSILALIIPTLTGTFSSLPRYVLVLFPCFISLGMVKDNKLSNLIKIVFAILAVVCIVMFYRGYWIA